MTSYFLVWHLIDSTSSKIFTAFFYRHTAESQTIPPPNGKEIPIGTLVCFLKRKFPCGIPTWNVWILYRNFPIFFKLKSLWGIPHRVDKASGKKNVVWHFDQSFCFCFIFEVYCFFLLKAKLFSLHFWGQRRSQALLINPLS